MQENQNKGTRSELADEADVRLMVDQFYTAVRQDDLIGPIFDEVIGDRWSEHLKKMYAFWNTVLFGSKAYSGRPFVPHMKLPVTKPHFDRWLLHFNNTVDTYFEGDKADEAKWRGEKMATLFLSKLEYMRQNPDKVLL